MPLFQILNINRLVNVNFWVRTKSSYIHIEGYIFSVHLNVFLNKFHDYTRNICKINTGPPLLNLFDNGF